MANGTGTDITGKFVRLRPEAHNEGYREPRHLIFKVADDNPGFGASPETMGTAVMGHYVCDGEKARVYGWDVVEVLDEGTALAIAEVAPEPSPANPLYPNGRCGACGQGLRDDFTCQNTECSRYVEEWTGGDGPDDALIHATINIYERDGQHWLQIGGNYLAPFADEDAAIDAIPDALRSTFED